MTPQELKNSILQLAIQGRLVPQRTEEKINEAEVIALEETPFEIPENWGWQTLGNCCDLYTGNSISESKKKEMYEGRKEGFDYIGTKDVLFTQKIVYDNGVKIPYENDFKRAYNKTILLCIEGGSAGRKIAILDREVCFGNKLCAFNANKIFYKFLFYYLQSSEFKKVFIENRTGIIGGVSIKKLKNIILPIPPLAEQKRIVAKIEELLPYIERYEKAYNELRQLNKRFPGDLQKSVLQLAIQGRLVPQCLEEGNAEDLYKQIQAEKQKLIKAGKIKKEKPLPAITDDEKPFEIPQSWKWVYIDDVCINLQYGTSKKSLTFGKVPVLRMNNIQNGRIVYNNLVYTNNDEDIAKYSLTVDDLLFNRTNSKELVGKVAIYKGDVPSIFAGYLVRITPFIICGDYLNYVMQTKYYWSYCQTVRSDAISQSNINAQKLKRFKVPLPPLVEQKRIVAKLEEILPLCDKLK